MCVYRQKEHQECILPAQAINTHPKYGMKNHQEEIKDYISLRPARNIAFFLKLENWFRSKSHLTLCNSKGFQLKSINAKKQPNVIGFCPPSYPIPILPNVSLPYFKRVYHFIMQKYGNVNSPHTRKQIPPFLVGKQCYSRNC